METIGTGLTHPGWCVYITSGGGTQRRDRDPWRHRYIVSLSVYRSYIPTMILGDLV